MVEVDVEDDKQDATCASSRVYSHELVHIKQPHNCELMYSLSKNQKRRMRAAERNTTMLCTIRQRIDKKCNVYDIAESIKHAMRDIRHNA